MNKFFTGEKKHYKYSIQKSKCVSKWGVKKMNKIVKENLGNIIKKIAMCKANANCIGFMYEPKKPKKLEKVSIQREEN